MPAPSALKKHDTLATGYWANLPKFLVSYLKSMYGAVATAENAFGYDWHSKIIGDHAHMPMFVAMALEVLTEWQLATTSPGFWQWLQQGAPSDDART